MLTLLNRFGVGGVMFSNTINHLALTVSFLSELLLHISAVTNVINHCQTHVHLCWMKLKMLLVPLTGHFIMKVS